MAEQEQPEKLKLEVSDLDQTEQLDIAVGRAYTVALAHDGYDAEAIKAEASEDEYAHAIETLGKYFELV